MHTVRRRLALRLVVLLVLVTQPVWAAEKYQERSTVPPNFLVTLPIQPARVTETYRCIAAYGSQGSGDGQFIRPYSVAVDRAGRFFVADTLNNRIQKFDGSCGLLTRWGRPGLGDGQFSMPSSLAVDHLGLVTVADMMHDRIQKFDSFGTFEAKWGVRGARNEQFFNPRGVAVDSTGAVYVADAGNHRIQKFYAYGRFVTSWGSLGQQNGYFNGTTGVAVDSGFYVYVADIGNHRIQKFDGSGRFITAWGRAGSADGEFNSNRGPVGIAVDRAGRVYVADEGSHRIQRFDSSGVFVAKWGTYGQRNGEFCNPMGVAVDNAGHVYVADTDNNRIQKFEALVPVEGTVLRDQQGIAAAPVVLRNQGTGAAARTQTDRAGNYRFDSVGAASPYEIQIDDLLLKEAAPLCGRLNFWGVPSTDISVTLESRIERTKVMKTRTDRTGSFCFQKVGGPETYRVTFDRVTVR